MSVSVLELGTELREQDRQVGRQRQAKEAHLARLLAWLSKLAWVGLDCRLWLRTALMTMFLT